MYNRSSSFVQRRKHGGNFVGNRFRGMKMPGIQTEQLFVPHRVTEIKLVRADNVAFAADAEEFGFDSVEIQFG